MNCPKHPNAWIGLNGPGFCPVCASEREAPCPSDAADCSAGRVLRLTLKRKWFDMIASGKKREEYREPGNWIMSRLVGKSYEVVEFSNGYGAHVPRVTCLYLGWTRGGGKTEWGASPDRHYVVIRLGDVISRQNDQGMGRRGAAPTSSDG